MRNRFMTMLCCIAIICSFILPSFVFMSNEVDVFGLSCQDNIIDFSLNGKHYRYVDEKIVPTDHLVAEEIQKRGINLSFDEKVRYIEKCLAFGASYEASFLQCFPLINGVIEQVVNDANTDPVDSTISFDPNRKKMFRITKEQVGYSLEPEQLYRDIYIHLKKKSIMSIIVSPEVVPAAVTSSDNIKLTNKRSNFSTYYELSTDGRKHNVELASSRINGTVLYPGQEFSFNGVVGKRSEANGYEEAKIIVNGEYADGVGGGVCQVSTTLYNAALKAGLEITAVRSHSLLSSYVPASFDAMVNSNSSDLKFKNTAKTPVFIRMTANGKIITAEIYGYPLKYNILTESVTLETTDPPQDREIIDEEYKYIDRETAVSGEKVRVSYSHGKTKSEGYLIYTDNSGNEVERKLIRKDTYSAVAGIVAIAPEVDQCELTDIEINEKMREDT